MEVEQIYTLINSVSGEVLGTSNVTFELKNFAVTVGLWNTSWS